MIGENFPYSNFHDMNMDWLIKIAKDFLDQYTTIQETITNGLEDLQTKTDDGITSLGDKATELLGDLDTKYENLSGLLQQWYNTHSEDIANELAAALRDISDALTTAVSNFNTQANAIGAEVLESIPADYTALADRVDALEGTDADWSSLEYVSIPNGKTLLTPKIPTGVGMYYDNNNVLTLDTSLTNFRYFILPVTSGTTYIIGPTDTSPLRWYVVTDDSDNIIASGQHQTGSLQIAYGGTKLYGSYQSGYNITIAKVGRATDGDHYYDLNVGDKLRIHVESCINALVQLNENCNVVNSGLQYDNLINMLQGKYSNIYADANMLISAPIAYGCYYAGKAVVNSSYNYAIVKVDSGVTYSYGHLRFLSSQFENIVNADASDDYEEYTADYTGFLFVTYPVDAPAYFCKKADYTAYILRINQAFNINSDFKKNNFFSKGFDRETDDSLTNNEAIRLPRTNITKNNNYNFSCIISSFGKILMGNGEALNQFGNSWLELDDTYLKIHNYTSSDEVVSYSHGLTFAGYIKININVKDNNTADITIITNGRTYNINTRWLGYGYGGYFVKSILSTLTDCEFTWSSSEFRKDTWIFGDSYLSLNDNTKWPYYTDPDKYLVNAYPGERSTIGLDALYYALTTYGKPMTLIWCYGMNDSGYAEWASCVEAVEALCKYYGIELILATIPTVPTIDNEEKNTDVRNSSYRYIDFANAVGATSEGVWYPDMLSSDGIHPTELGAKALANMAMIDAPEIDF